MRKLLYSLLLSGCVCTLASSCGDDGNDWTDYAEWRETNLQWYNTQAERKNEDGTPFFTRVNPDWYPESKVLIHYFNDRTETADNLSPLITSHVTVKYTGELYDGTVFDKTTTGSDSERTFQLNGTIVGWQLALTQMHVGDTCEVIIPYAQGYGPQGSESISPYSTLKFNIRLVDIPQYEIPDIK